MSDSQHLPPNSETTKTLDDRPTRKSPTAESLQEPSKLSPLPALGQRLVKRYTVLQVLGEGGMGVVLAAYDEQLDRRVALKLLRQVDADNSMLEARLVREAQAMARLNHPHVVAVYDSGRMEDGTFFIAMEYVEGQTLQTWCQQEHRSWREILSAYLEAGRGLAAAHAVDLIHRDFKPANVLVGRDGRVRVTDFGVARMDASSNADMSAPLPAESWEMPLTLPGHVVGTPKFLAPELLKGQLADVRSDLFSFCVALYEALYGQPPFSGATANERMRAQQEGRITSPPAKTQVPSWVGRAVVQGLSAEPEKRPASMQVLITSLQDDPEGRRKKQLRVGLGVGGVAALVGLSVWIGGRWQVPGCNAMEQRLAGVWDAPMKARVRETLMGTGLSYAADTAQRVEVALDNYTSTWLKMSQEVCEASKTSTGRRRSFMALREACLERRHSQLRSLTKLFAGSPDPVFLPNALQAVQSLHPLEYCADEKALLARVPPPEDPELRERVDQLQLRMDELESLLATGKYADGLALANKTISEVEGVEFAPLRAEAHYLVARFQAELGNPQLAEAELRKAIPQAARGGDDLLLARSWELLTFVMVHQQNRPREALQLELTLETVVEQARNKVLHATALNIMGAAFQALGRNQEALTRHERALAIKEKVLGPEHPNTAIALTQLGTVLVQMRRYEEGLKYLERSLKLEEKVLGPEHPIVASALLNMGLALGEMGRYEEALTHLQHSLTLTEKALGPDAPDVAIRHSQLGAVLARMGRYEEALAQNERTIALMKSGIEHPSMAPALINVSSLLQEMGRYEEAIPYLEHVLELKKKELGPNHPTVAKVRSSLGTTLYKMGRYTDARIQYNMALKKMKRAFGHEHTEVATSLNNLGIVLHKLGKSNEALERHERALALNEKALGPEHPEVATSLNNLGVVLQTLGRYKEAQARHERALALIEKGLGPKHPRMAEPLLRLGELHLEQRRPVQAVVLLERALSVTRAQDKAEMQFSLARALWESGGEKQHALKLATLAHAQWKSYKHPRQAEAAQWIASHALP